jgi:hypothetical protein
LAELALLDIRTYYKSTVISTGINNRQQKRIWSPETASIYMQLSVRQSQSFRPVEREASPEQLVSTMKKSGHGSLPHTILKKNPD